jgi:glycine hydroxymethyltransferase
MAHTFKELGYRIVSDGTDNHLFVLDLRSKNMNGRQAEIALSKAGITISRSCVPFDTEKPWITSGIRIGTPAITTRGMMVRQAQEIAHLIDDVLMHHTDDTALAHRAQAVERLCHDFTSGL